MGGLLPLGGIAALAVLGFVVWVNAFTSNPPAESDGSRDRALARERRRLRREQLRRQAQQASSAGRRGVRAVAWRAVALADEWLPRLRHHAHDARVRWPTLDSTIGQLIVGIAASLVLAWLIVALG